MNPYKLGALKVSVFSSLRKNLNKDFIDRKQSTVDKISFYNAFASKLGLFPFFVDTFKYFFLDASGSFNKQLRIKPYSKVFVNRKSFRRPGFLNEEDLKKRLSRGALSKSPSDSIYFLNPSWYENRLKSLEEEEEEKKRTGAVQDIA